MKLQASQDATDVLGEDPDLPVQRGAPDHSGQDATPPGKSQRTTISFTYISK